jgi:transposase
MAKPLVSDALWERVKPHLPERPPKPFGGRPPIDDRKALAGILFVLKTGIPWEDLPQEMGCGCGMTCWRRLRDWMDLGVWEAVKQAVLAELRGAGRIDWSRAVIDSSSVRAVGAGKKRGPTRPTAANRAASITW